MEAKRMREMALLRELWKALETAEGMQVGVVADILLWVSACMCAEADCSPGEASSTILHRIEAIRNTPPEILLENFQIRGEEIEC